MKRKWKPLRLLAAAMTAALLLAGCGAGSDNSATSSMAMSATDEMEITMDAANGLETGEIDANTLEDSERKIVYTASVSIETDTFEDSSDTIQQLVDEAGGYIASSSLRGNTGRGSRSVSYSCKIPAEHYKRFLESLSGTGNVYRVNQYTDDITTQYVDVEARLSTLENQRKRLEELASEAEDIDTLLSIETQLGEVQYQLESYTAQMRTLQNQVSYSTVDIDLSEVANVSEGTAFGTRVKAAFGGSWDTFVAAVQGLIIALIYLLPGLVVLAVILAVVIPLVIRHKRKERARKPASPAPGQWTGWKTPAEKPEQPPVPEEKPDTKTDPDKS